MALALSEAMALSGRITDAVRVLQTALEEQPGDYHATQDALQAALLNTARWGLETRPLTRPLVERIKTRADRGEQLSPQLHANLATELAAAGEDREQAVYHARAAAQALSAMMSVSAPALPGTISVLVFADLATEARERTLAWLQLAQQRGWPLASAVAATGAALTAMYSGDVSDALAYGEQALASAGWVPVLTVGLLVRTLVDRGAVDQGHALLAEHDLDGDLGPIWPYNVVRHARGRLHAAAGDHAAACTDLLAAGDFATRYGIRNPVMFPWRSDAALSLSALGDHERARELAAEDMSLARQWGTSRGVGVALRTAALVGDADRRIGLLTDSIEALRSSPARLELARALVDLGAACRRSGLVSEARVHLREGLDLAHELGALSLADQARTELITAGGRPRRDAIRGRDALTPSELRVALLAAAGQTNRQIAQALFVTRRTVETHLTSSYEKLGIRSRSDLQGALGEGHPVLAG